jgi:hypothetical protein
MSSMDRIRRETIEQYGDAPANAIEALDHVLALYADEPDDRLMVEATNGIYGDGVRTGLTMGDLRVLRDSLPTVKAYTCPTCGAPNATRAALDFHTDAAH